MNILPRSQSSQQRKKVEWVASDNTEAAQSDILPSLETRTDINNPSKPKPTSVSHDNNQDSREADMQTPGPHINTTRITPSQAIGIVQGEFDEYGTELGPEARVWKTYVKEADRFDAEKVEEWNKSLDVMLIFAALFSAISTTFVMESSKKLQADPADTSAKTLAVISQTLLTIVNSSQTSTASELTLSANEEFSPSRSDVCVNVLWFLSLSISVAVSLIAMLAKEWCYIFMSNRTGHPCSQAKRRQQRWDALEQWKMPELLMFLPSLIHLALLLFATGLCIYLWDMHFAVALPVLIVTLAAIGAYTATTILPLIYQLCPYSTAASRFIRSFSNALFSNDQDTGAAMVNLEQDVISSKALRWLIEKCEDPRSVDTALQAIAGADEKLPLEPLKECHADKMVGQRMTAGSSYSKNYEVVFKLYARAFAVLQPPVKSQLHEKGKYNDINELTRKIRNLQVVTERTVASLLATKELVPTQTNLLALRIGSAAAFRSLESLSYGSQSQVLEYFGPAVDLLEKHWIDNRILHPAVIQSLVIGTAMLLACSAVNSDPSVIAPYLIRLLAASPSQGDHVLGILLTAFSLARNDYPGWIHPNPLGDAARAERAIEAVTYYAPIHVLDNLGKVSPGTLKNFGLLELLFNIKDYKLVGSDLNAIYGTITLDWVDDPHVIHTFPPSFDQRQYVRDLITRKISAVHQQEDSYAEEGLVEAYMVALGFTYNLWVGPLTSLVYVFVLESMCRVPTDRILSRGNALMANIPLFDLSSDLATLIENRGIVSLLAIALDSTHSQVRIHAAEQMHKILELILYTPRERNGGWNIFLVKLFRCEELCDPPQRLATLKEALADELVRMYDEGPSSGKSSNKVANLKIKLRELQAITSRNVARWLSEDFTPTKSNALALRVGGMAISLCLQYLGSSNTGYVLSALNVAVPLLEKCGDDPHLLHPAALRSLVIGTMALLSCSAVHIDSLTIAPFVIRLLHAGLSNRTLGILLAAFTIARDNYPGYTDPFLQSPTTRAERAVEFATYYTPLLGHAKQIPYKAMKALALTTLLSRSNEYGLADREFVAIYTEFKPTWRSQKKKAVLHTFPPKFHPGRHVMEHITEILSSPERLDFVLSSRVSVVAHLDAVRCTYSRSIGPPSPQIYEFVWESLCRPSSLWGEIIGEQLVTSFPPPNLSNHLENLVGGRRISNLLANALLSNSMRVKVFATAQVCLLIRLLLDAPDQLRGSYGYLLDSLFRSEEICNPLTRLKEVKKVLTQRLLEMRTEFPQYSSAMIYPKDQEQQPQPSNKDNIPMPVINSSAPGHELAGPIIPSPLSSSSPSLSSSPASPISTASPLGLPAPLSSKSSSLSDVAAPSVPASERSTTPDWPVVLYSGPASQSDSEDEKSN